MRALVTGGAGFIGSHIVDALLAEGHEVRVLDNFSTGRRVNLERAGDEVEVIEGDLRSYERVHNAVRGTELVFHQGALPSVPRSVQDPLTSSAVNVEGTLNVLLASRDEGVRRVVFASSSSVYGDAPGFPRREDQLLTPIAPYAVSKMAAEAYCQSFHRIYGLETVALRYFNVFGPRQDANSQYSAVIPLFATQLMQGEAPVVHGDGTQSRDFTHIDNVVHANLLAAEAPEAVGLAVNIACGGGHSLLELIAHLGEVIGVSADPRFVAPRSGDVMRSEADIALARGTLGFEPTVGFRAGLEDACAWYAEVGAAASPVAR